MQGNVNCKCPPPHHPKLPPNVLPLIFQNKIIMTILNRNQLQGREGMFWNRVCVEMAKREGFTSKAGGSVGRNKQWEPWEWNSGGGGWEMTPGPISSLIEKEHRFSALRTKIPRSWDDSRLTAPRHFLHRPRLAGRARERATGRVLAALRLALK